MKGHLTQRGKSKTWYAVWDDYRGGKRQRRWTNLHTTSKREANERLAKLIASWSDGNVPPTGRLTVAEHLANWLTTRKTAGRAPKTIWSYGTMIRLHIAPSIGHMQLTALRPQHLEAHYAAELGRGLAPRTVAYQHAIIRAALRHAVRQGLIPRSPCDQVTAPTVYTEEQKVLTPEQAAHFLDVLHGHRLYALFFVALSTGMREGELIGLRWSDVDFAGRRLMVRVQRQYEQGEGMVERPTKEHRGTKVIELTDDEVAVLQQHRKRIDAERADLTDRFGVDVWQDYDLVFPSAVGTPLSPSNLRRLHQATLAKAGLEGVKVHGLRHTAATLMLSADGRVLVASRRLGHADPATTARMYGHTLPGDQREAAEKAMQSVLRRRGSEGADTRPVRSLTATLRQPRLALAKRPQAPPMYSSQAQYPRRSACPL